MVAVALSATRDLGPGPAEDSGEGDSEEEDDDEGDDDVQRRRGIHLNLMIHNLVKQNALIRTHYFLMSH